MARRVLTTGLTFILLMVGSLVLFTQGKADALSGSDFNPAHIMGDDIFFAPNTMNTGDIQNFFNAKVPVCDTNGTQIYSGSQTRAQYGTSKGVPPPYTCLKDHSQSFNSVNADAYCGFIGGGQKSAADIVFNVAQACGISPKVLIVLLQKEQSLVTDAWPWPIQYRSATGYGCPDTAACDSQYYGFFNQVYNAARQFKRYTIQPQNFNYAVSRTSFVSYQANSPGCGGTNITMQTRATAALYNYTPYQPNAAALGNLYGTGDGCSAYGNRNFWRMFNDWFGPTIGDGYTLARNTSDNTQWVIYRNIRQYVPSAEIKSAYGLPDTPVDMENDYLVTISQGPNLGRLFHLIGDPVLYFADNGKKYRVTTPQMRDAWGFTGQTESFVSFGLWNLPQYNGFLTYSVKKSSSPALYMVEGPNGSGQLVLRQYSSPDVYHAWEGDVDNYTTVSDMYFNEIDNAVGSNLTTTKIAYGGNEYQVISGQRMAQPASVAGLYPGVAQSVSETTFNRLVPTSQATHLARSVSSPDVYLIDNGTKHHVTTGELLGAWGANQSINILNNGYMSLIPNGTAVTGYLADVSGQLYIINGHKTIVPSAVDAAYRNSETVYTATSTLMNLFSTHSINATGFIKAANSSPVYMLDNSGKKRHIDSSDKLSLWQGNNDITILNNNMVSSIQSAASPGIFVSDGTTEYVMENGQKVTVSSGVKTDWGLSDAQIFSDGTLSRFSSGGSLDNKMKSDSFYYWIRGGNAYVTTDQNIANAWAIDTAASRNKKLISLLIPQHMLTRFVQSSTGSQKYVIENGEWYSITDAQRANLGRSNEPAAVLNPSYAPNSITAWTSTVVKDSSGKHYVIDGATKRGFANATIQNHWTGNGSLTVPTTTNGFLNLLPTAANIERAIKGSSHQVYSAESGTKRWVQSTSTYNVSYAPFAPVSDVLINVLPSGSAIP
jgi:hypothetical protein